LKRLTSLPAFEYSTWLPIFQKTIADVQSASNIHVAYELAKSQCAQDNLLAKLVAISASWVRWYL
jgi:hypothetical protein